MNHSYLAIVSGLATERTSCQKFILAALVSSLLLMTSAVYADVAFTSCRGCSCRNKPGS